MASVHPSRMGLVPLSRPSRGMQERRGRSPSPRVRYRDSTRSRDRDERRNDYERDGAEGMRAAYERRPSPKYEDYRQAPPHIVPPRPSIYAGRGGGGGAGGGGGRGGMSNSDWFESRRAQREAMSVDVWPPSPKAPARSLSPRRKKSSRKYKRGRSLSSDDSSSSEEERRRKKEKKRARKERYSEEKRHHRHRSRSVRSRSPSRERHRPPKDRASEAEEDRRRHKGRSRSRSLRVAIVTSPSRQPPPSPSPAPERQPQSPLLGQSRETSVVHGGDKGKGRQESDDDDEVGPRPILQANASKRFNERDYGGALLRGEGSAMAAFLQDDPSVRIPRRGEIGLTSDQIARYETVGYVMSGSRHKRMNAVRMRKENQVISAEEKRGILKLQKEERERREAILREEFNEIVNEKLKAANVNVDLASIQPPPQHS